jgi:hypothetical protein
LGGNCKLDAILPARRVVTFKWSGKLREKINGKYKVLKGTFRDVIKNIGAGGLSVRTNRKVVVGQPITIKLPLFNFDSYDEGNW